MFENIKYIKTNGRRLSANELEKFISFYFALTQNGKTCIFFRGENYQNLKKKFSLNDNDDFIKLNALIFLIGDKGRVYREEYKKQIKKKKKIYPIDSIDKVFFKKIFDKFNYILTEKIDNEVVKQFKNNNIIFDNYFSNKKNLSDFISKLSSIRNTQIKLKIRDYYLNLLHQIGKIGFYKNSFFVSTTSDIYVAEKFASNEKGTEKIIFIGWINYPLYHKGVTFNYLNKVNDLNQKLLSLPTYSKSFFPKQKEILIKGGLLPHFILGYLRVDKNEFIVNPNLFTTTKSFRDTIINGFEIDQSEFDSKLIETDYSGYFMLDDNGIYSDSNN